MNRKRRTFSPPDSCSISRKRLLGGMAVNFIPARKGSSVFSRLRYAVPPTGFTLHAHTNTLQPPHLTPASKPVKCPAKAHSKIQACPNIGACCVAMALHFNLRTKCCIVIFRDRHTSGTVMDVQSLISNLSEELLLPAAGELLEDGVDDRGDVLKGG